VVRTSDEAGMIYALSHPEYGEDMGRVVKDLNKRFEWIWNHDLEGDVRLADKELAVGKAGKR
jgi:salicylate hydroxylase